MNFKNSSRIIDIWWLHPIPSSLSALTAPPQRLCHRSWCRHVSKSLQPAGWSWAVKGNCFPSSSSLCWIDVWAHLAIDRNFRFRLLLKHHHKCNTEWQFIIPRKMKNQFPKFPQISMSDLFKSFVPSAPKFGIAPVWGISSPGNLKTFSYVQPVVTVHFPACWSKLLKSCCGCSSLWARRTWTCTGGQ